MKKKGYRSIELESKLERRDFLKIGGGSLLGAGLLLGRPPLFGQEAAKVEPPAKPKTNIDEAMAVPRTKNSLPGLFPGKVVAVKDERAMNEKGVDGKVVASMFEKGIQALTGKPLDKSFKLFFDKNDVVGIKVNPVGAGLIATRLEVVDAIIAWLRQGGLPAKNIVIWDRFDYMLADAGFTAARYPGIAHRGAADHGRGRRRRARARTTAAGWARTAAMSAKRTSTWTPIISPTSRRRRTSPTSTSTCSTASTPISASC